ncbi:MAG: DUF262 domain-containing protein [Candidatus Omnitrophica bacterium]|nr:DUF262 domain-containing protein [Candidatus Omnitrophota bacterium]
MDLSYGQKSLHELVKKAYVGEVMLPDFQRNFVWDRSSIEELIESILSNLFIGTFLILHTFPGKEPFKTIFVSGAESINPNIEAKPNIIILDGQQRLTSLFYAIYVPNIPLKNTTKPYKFFINLNKLAQNNIDEAVFSYSIEDWKYKKLLKNNKDFNISKLKDEYIMPLEMFKEQSSFYHLWYTEFSNLFSDDNEKEKIRSFLDRIFNYKVYTLSLSYDFNNYPEKIVSLFERLNRTGVRLSTYDLLIARMYKFINLREEWEAIFDNIENYQNIKKLANFRIDNTDVPFTLIKALILSKGESIKDSDLIKIDNNILNKKEWERLVDISEKKALNRIFDLNYYGINEDINRWLPFSTMLIPIIALYLAFDHPDIQKINRWYWSVVFSESYSSGVTSKIIKDFKEMCKWFYDDYAEPEIVKEFKKDIEMKRFSLKDKKQAQSSLYKGIMNLIFMNKPLDFYQPEDISYNELNDHHIFPKNFIKEKEVNVDVDIVLNRTLILDRTNKKIYNKSPADYLDEMIEIQMEKKLSRNQAEEKVKDILKKHFINEEMYEIMKNTSLDKSKEEIKNNFDRFIQLRENLILERIRELLS